jgi:NitT/TauT family transport system substrate-binding protein
MKRIFSHSPRWCRLSALALAIAVAGCDRKPADRAGNGASTDGRETARRVLAVGFFPNITHAQAIVAQQMEHENHAWFAANFPKGLALQWYPFNAGPNAMEALLLGSVQLSYVGPNPALNAYVRTRGDELCQLAGAARGGGALVVRAGVEATTPAQFAGKKIGTPQYGNTQDVACRLWLARGGLRILPSGGDAHVIPMQNPELHQVFGQGGVDAAWTVEPWVSRIVRDFKGRIVVEQPDDITTLLVTGTSQLKARGGDIRAFTAAHIALTAWIGDNGAEAAALLHRGLERITRTKLDPELIALALRRITFSATVDRAAMQKFVEEARSIEMLPANIPPLDNFFRHATAQPTPDTIRSGTPQPR